MLAACWVACSADDGTRQDTRPATPGAGAGGAPSAPQNPGSTPADPAPDGEGTGAEPPLGSVDPSAPAPGGPEPSPEGSAGAGGGAGTEGAAPLGPGPLVTPDGSIRIMAMGDSITRATCWRAELWQALEQRFSGRFDFVGTLSENQGCAPAGYDRDNQAYSSSLLTEIVAGITDARTCDPACPTLGELSEAFVTARPDVILVHFGTNDVWNGRPTASILEGYSALVDAARAANPNVVVLVAQIIPMNVSDATCGGCTCAGCPTAVPALGEAVVTWASEKSTPESPIVPVDQYSGFDPNADTRDGVHPNADGDRKLAERWLAALEPLF